MIEIELTEAEKKAIKTLNRLAKTWPKSLWLFSGGGTLCVMRYKDDGTVAIIPSGGIDGDYVVAAIEIANSGGDW